MSSYILIEVLFGFIFIGMLFVILYMSTTPAGCYNKYIPFTGGCFGKNSIKNFKIENGLPSCIQIKPSDCQGAKLEVYNNCDEEVMINGEKINKNYNYLLLVRADNGTIIQDKEHAGYEYPYPKQNEFINVDGSVGDNKFIISYVRTKSLCN